MQTIVPNLSETELLLDRIPKPTFLPDNTSLDVLVRVHVFHAKEGVLSVAKNIHTLLEPYSVVKLYAELSAINNKA